VLKYGSPVTKSASGRSRTKVAKAASISRPVLALRTRICSPMVQAAPSSSFSVASAAGLSGLVSTATRAVPGTSSRKSSKFCVQLCSKRGDTCHVATRPRQAHHKTEGDRIFGDIEDDRDRGGCHLGGSGADSAPRSRRSLRLVDELSAPPAPAVVRLDCLPSGSRWRCSRSRNNPRP